MKRIIILLILIVPANIYSQDNNTKPYKVLEGHKHKVSNAFYSPDGKLIISHGWDNTIKIWDAKTFLEIRTFKGHINQVWSAAISSDNRFLASGSMDRTFIIWDVESSAFVDTLGIHSMNRMRANYSPDRKYLISGSLDNNGSRGETIIWETESYTQVSNIKSTGDILFTDNNELGIYKGDCTMDYYDL